MSVIDIYPHPQLLAEYNQLGRFAQAPIFGAIFVGALFAGVQCAGVQCAGETANWAPESEGPNLPGLRRGAQFA